MKKVLTLFLASLLGGILALLVYVKFFQKKVVLPVSNYEDSRTNFTNQNTVNSVFSDLDFTVAAKKTVDAVVHVKIRTRVSNSQSFLYDYLFGRQPNQGTQTPITSAGSGVIISNDGYIVTNNHVIESADILEVTLNDKRTFTARVIGSDPTTDIALIKIDSENLPFIDWGDSDELQVGEWVLAVGNPFNLASTVTAGIVSAKARSINIINKNTAIEAFIQTDAAVNPGNSGGALVNTEGKLVGINTAIASTTGSFSGYSFAVPERLAKKIVNDIIEYGSVQRAFIGVSITDVTSELAKSRGVETTKGVYVSAVVNGGAADEAGVEAGDIILKIKGVEVNRTSELQEQVGQHRPGDQISVTVLRGKKKKNLLLTLRNIEGRTDIVKNYDNLKILGATFKTVSSSKAKDLKIKGGAEIIDVGSGKFYQAGIKDGFIVTSINRQKVYDTEDMKLLFNDMEGGVYVEGVYPNGLSAYYAFGI